MSRDLREVRAGGMVTCQRLNRMLIAGSKGGGLLTKKGRPGWLGRVIRKDAPWCGGVVVVQVIPYTSSADQASDNER